MHTKNIALALLAGALVIGAATGNRGSQGSQGLRALPANPTAAEIDLLDAVPFVLDEPFVHTWRADQPSYRAGYLVVLRTDPDLTTPRQSAEPVLYVGEQTAERCNAGTEAGTLVCVVPAELLPDGSIDLDPTTAPIWFGAAELPERLDANAILTAHRTALSQGIGPATLSTRMRRAQSASIGANAFFARDRAELNLPIADLIETYSPTETDLVEGLRVPITRR